MEWKLKSELVCNTQDILQNNWIATVVARCLMFVFVLLICCFIDERDYIMPLYNVFSAIYFKVKCKSALTASLFKFELNKLIFQSGEGPSAQDRVHSYLLYNFRKRTLKSIFKCICIHILTIVHFSSRYFGREILHNE